MPLDAVCDFGGRCSWQDSGWYRGCINDTPFLAFDRFDYDGILDIYEHIYQNIYLHIITENDATYYLKKSQTKHAINVLCYLK